MIWYHISEMTAPKAVPPPKPTFRGQTIRYTDPKSGEVHTVEERFTINLDFIREEEAARIKQLPKDPEIPLPKE
jgi:hypothetical protein